MNQIYKALRRQNSIVGGLRMDTFQELPFILYDPPKGLRLLALLGHGRLAALLSFD